MVQSTTLNQHPIVQIFTAPLLLSHPLKLNSHHSLDPSIYQSMLKITIKDMQGTMHILTIRPNGDNSDLTLVNTTTNAEQMLSVPAASAQGMSILDLCEQLGLDLPYSCRAGACTSCLCEVQKGKEFLDQNTAGEPIIDIGESEFLACIGGCQTEALSSPEEQVVEMESKGL